MYYLQKPLPQIIPKFTFLVLKENFLITTPKEQHIVWNSQDDSQVCTHLKICGGKCLKTSFRQGYTLPPMISSLSFSIGKLKVKMTALCTSQRGCGMQWMMKVVLRCDSLSSWTLLLLNSGSRHAKHCAKWTCSLNSTHLEIWPLSCLGSWELAVFCSRSL